MQVGSRKNERKKQKSMTLNLLRKSMALSSKYEVDVLVVVFDRTSGAFQEFCSRDFQTLLDNVLAARDLSSNYTSYKLEDMPSLPEEDLEFPQGPNKHPRTHSPALSHTSSLPGLPTSLPRAPRPRKTKDNEVAGFLAMLKGQQPSAPPAPTISTEDTAEPLSQLSTQGNGLQEKWQEDRLQEDEEWKDSPSDFLLDP